jgi:hypothetical protein
MNEIGTLGPRFPMAQGTGAPVAAGAGKTPKGYPSEYSFCGY